MKLHRPFPLTTPEDGKATLALYCSVLFWLVAFMSGVLGSYDSRPGLIPPMLVLALFIGGLVFGVWGLFEPGPMCKVVAGASLLILIGLPAALLLKRIF